MIFKYFYHFFSFLLIGLTFFSYGKIVFSTSYHFEHNFLKEKDFKPLKNKLESLLVSKGLFKKKLIEEYLWTHGYRAHVSFKGDKPGSIIFRVTFPFSTFIINDLECFSSKEGFTPAPCCLDQNNTVTITAPSSFVHSWKLNSTALVDLEERLRGSYSLTVSSFSYLRYQDFQGRECLFSLEEPWAEKIQQCLLKSF
jgi:hypothetical protein